MTQASESVSMPQMFHVFFSHGGDDTYIAQHFLMPKVESAGASVFLDTGQIAYGDDFRRRILAELVLCHELLVLLTQSSLRRPWVFAEIGATLIKNKRVVAIRYGPGEAELQALGVLSLLGTTSLMRMDDFDDYVEQLRSRVREALS